MKYILSLAPIALGLSCLRDFAEGEGLASMIRLRLAESVEAELEVEALGVQNCLNKCDKMFNNMAYAILTQNPGSQTNEYRACVVGCQICKAQLNDATNTDSGRCLSICKDTNWLDARGTNGSVDPIVKGVIEPDKACEIGCIQNMCQGVCTGGTPDIKATSANSDLVWDGKPNPNRGCSIKTGAVRPGGFYSQSAEYSWWNSAAGPGGVSSCCSNGISLCRYRGDKSSTNYNDVIGSAQRGCSNVPGVGSSATVAQICAYVRTPGNCGNRLGNAGGP